MTVSSEWCPYIWQGEAPGLTLNPSVQPEPRDLEWAEPGSNARSAPCWLSHLRQDPGLPGLSTILASWGCWYPSQQDNVHPVSGKAPWHVVGAVCCPQTPPSYAPTPALAALDPTQRRSSEDLERPCAEASTQGPGWGADHQPQSGGARCAGERLLGVGGSLPPLHWSRPCVE